jgi:hypothetical protein
MLAHDPISPKVVPFRRKAAALAALAEELKPDRHEAWRRQTRTNIAALLVSAALVAIGVLLVHKLATMSRIEDCLMSGRTNCAPIALQDRAS